MYNNALKVVDKNGLIYFTQLLHKAVEEQIKASLTEQALTVKDFEKRLTELAEQKSVVSKATLDGAIKDLEALIDSTAADLKKQLEAEIKALALDAVEDDVKDAVADALKDALLENDLMTSDVANERFLSKSDAQTLYVQKAGDTMVGTLNGTNIVASGDVKAGTFTTASGIIFS